MNIEILRNLSQQDIESMAKELLIQPNRLSKLSSEVVQLCEQSHCKHAFEKLVDHSSNLINVEKRVKTNIQDSPVLVEDRRIDTYLSETMFDSLKQLETSMQSRGNASYLLSKILYNQKSSDSSLRRIFYDIYISTGGENESESISDPFSDSVEMAVHEVDSLQSYLMLLYGLLSSLQDPSSQSQPISVSTSALSKLAEPKLISKSDVRLVDAFVKEMDRSLYFKLSPALVVTHGRPSKLTSSEVHGQCGGYVGNIDVCKQGTTDHLYFEVKVKGEVQAGVRIGWGVRPSHDRFHVPAGDEADSWAYCGFTGHIYHNAAGVRQARLADIANPASAESKVESETAESKADAKNDSLADKKAATEEELVSPQNEAQPPLAIDTAEPKSPPTTQTQSKKEVAERPYKFSFSDVFTDADEHEHEDEDEDEANERLMRMLMASSDEDASPKVVSAKESAMLTPPPSAQAKEVDRGRSEEGDDAKRLRSVMKLVRLGMDTSTILSIIGRDEPLSADLENLIQNCRISEIRRPSVGLIASDVLRLAGLPVSSTAAQSQTGPDDSARRKAAENGDVPVASFQDTEGAKAEANTSLWNSGVIVGCYLNRKTMIMSFYNDGELVLTLPVPTSETPLNSSEFCPVFECDDGTALDFNFGTTPFLNAFKIEAIATSSEFAAEPDKWSESAVSSDSTNPNLVVIDNVSIDLTAKSISVNISTKQSDNSEVLTNLKRLRLLLGKGKTQFMKFETSNSSNEEYMRGSAYFNFSDLPLSSLSSPASLIVLDEASPVVFKPLDYVSPSPGTHSPALKSPKNRAGNYVVIGKDGITYYCGRSCGPDDGYQCKDCKGLFLHTPICSKQHPMQLLLSNPPEYSSPTSCDICKERDISRKGRFLYHCKPCSYDACDSCTYRSAHKVKGIAEPLIVESHAPPSFSIKPRSISWYLTLDQSSTNPSFIALPSSSMKPTSTMTIEASFRLKQKASESETSDADGSQILEFEMSDASTGSMKCKLEVSEKTKSLCFIADSAQVIHTPDGLLDFRSWKHVAVIISRNASENASVSLFLDGVCLQKASFSTSTLSSKEFTLSEGRFGGAKSSGHRLPVAIDVCMLRIWSCARSDDEIKQRYGRGAVFGNEPNLIALLPFIEGTGDLLRNMVTSSEGLDDPDTDVGSFATVEGPHEWHSLEELSLKSLIVKHKFSNAVASSVQSTTRGCLEAIVTSLNCSVSNYYEWTSGSTSEELGQIKSLMIQMRSVSDPNKLTFELLYSILQLGAKLLLESTEFVSEAADVVLCALSILEVNLVSVRSNSDRLSLMFSEKCTSSKSSICRKLVKELLHQIERMSDRDIDSPLETVRVKCMDLLFSGFQLFFPTAMLRLAFFVGVLDKLHLSNETSDNRTSQQQPMKKIEYIEDCLSSLTSMGLKSLYPKLCRYFSDLKNTFEFIPQEHMPSPDESLVDVSSVSNLELSEKYSLRHTHGAVVERGADWIYHDQDGGPNNRGIVIKVTDWETSGISNNDAFAVTVLWSTGYSNTYRWGVSDSSPTDSEEPVRRYDLKFVLAPISNMKKSTSHVAQKSTKVLVYTPQQIAESIENSISVPEVISIIIDNADKHFKEQNSLNVPTEFLLTTLSKDEVISLYESLYQYLYDETSITLSDEYLAHLFKALCHSVYKKSSALVKTDGASAVSSEYTDEINLLLAIQGVLLASISPSSDQDTKLSLSLPSLHDRVLRQPFFVESSYEWKWVWADGVWRKASAKEPEIAVRVPLGQAGEKAVVPMKLLSEMNFDSGYNSESLTLSNKYRTVHQTANRVWSTILGSVALQPHSGVYHWYSVIDKIGSKRCHCIFGVATDDSNFDGFLGQDNESWGISTNKELFHGGVKLQASFGESISIGNVIELILDTDSGTLSVRDTSRSEGPVIAFTGLNDLVLYPAWTLYAPGDSVSVLPSLKREVSAIQTMQSDQKASHSWRYGTPTSMLFEYAMDLITTASSGLDSNERFVSHPLVSVSLTHILSRFLTYQRFPSTTLLHQELMRLLTVVAAALKRARSRSSSLSSYPSSESLSEALLQITPTQAPVRSVRRSRGAVAELFDKSAYGAIVIEDGNLIIELLTQLSSLVCLCIGRVVNIQVVGEDQPNNIDLFQSQPDSKGYSEMFSTMKENRQWLQSKLFAGGLVNEALEVTQLLVELNGNNPSSAIEQVFQWIINQDTKNSAFYKSNNQAVLFLIKYVFLAHLHHIGALSYFIRLVQFLKNDSFSSDSILTGRPVPSVLLRVWDEAAKIRLEVSKILQLGNESLETFSDSAVSHVRFLFCLRPHYSDFFDVGVAIESLSELLDKLSTVEYSARATVVLPLVSRFMMSKAPVSTLRYQLQHCQSQVEQRAEAFTNLMSVFTQVSTELPLGWAVKASLLYFIPQTNKYSPVAILRSNSGSSHSSNELHHYSFGLRCSQLDSLRKVFNSLFAYLVSELKVVVTSASGTSADVWSFVFTLITCLTVPITQEDTAVLLETDLLSTLDKLLDTGHFTDSILPTEVAKAINKLVTFMSFQIILLEDKEQLEPSTSTVSLSAVIFESFYSRLDHLVQELRVNLTSHMSVSNAGVESKSPAYLVILDLSADKARTIQDMVTVLLSFMTSQKCVIAMSKPRWISLFVDLSLLGPIESRQYSIQLLAYVLKIFDGTDDDMSILLERVSEYSEVYGISSELNEVTSETIFASLVRLFVATGCPLLQFAPLFVPLSRTDLDDSAKANLISSAFVAIQSESVSLLRSLFSNPKWSTAVHSFASDVLDSYALKLESLTEERLDSAAISQVDTNFCVSCLALLGGHVDVPFVGSYALIEDDQGRYSDFGVVTVVHESAELVDIDAENLFENAIFDNALSYGRMMERRLRPKARRFVASMPVIRLKTINRVPVESLSIPLELIRSILKITKNVLSCVSKISKLSTDKNLKLISCCAYQSISTLCRVPSHVPIIQSCFSQDIKLYLDCSNQLTESGGLSDLPIMEPHLFTILSFCSSNSLKKELKRLSPAVPKPDVNVVISETEQKEASASANASAITSEPLHDLRDGPGEDEDIGIMGGDLVDEAYEDVFTDAVNVSRGGPGDQPPTSETASNEPFQTPSQEMNLAAPLLSLPAQSLIPDVPLDEVMMPEVDEEEEHPFLETLITMGFERRVCMLALNVCGDLDEAVNYLLSHGSELERMVSAMSRGESEPPRREPERLFDLNLGISAPGRPDTATRAESKSEAPQPNESFLSSMRNRLLEATRDALAEDDEEHSGDMDEYPKEYHYDVTQTKFLPVYTDPSFASERVNGIFPGDEVWVFGEFKDSKCNWLRLRLSDLDENVASLAGDVFVWAPESIDGAVVVHPGDCNQPSENLELSGSGCIPMDCVYEVCKGETAIVREDLENDASEVRVLVGGELVKAVEECFNSRGYPCLKIVLPCAGWVLKTCGVLKCQSGQTSIQENTTESKIASAPTESKEDDCSLEEREQQEWLKIEAINDDMEQLDGSEGYRKEDRFFGTLQGLNYNRSVDASKTRLQSFQQRRSRVMGASSRASYRQALASHSNIDGLFCSTSDIVTVLQCRKIMLACFYLPSDSATSEFDFVLNSPAKLPTPTTEAATPTPTVGHVESMASKLIKFVMLCAFRGDPSYSSSMEHLAYDDITYVGIPKELLTVDMALRQRLLLLLECTIHNSEFGRHLRRACMLSILLHVRQACESPNTDAMWSDFGYDEDADNDCITQANIHYAVWMSRILCSKSSLDDIKSVFKLWCKSGLKASSMSLKHISFELLSDILQLLRSSYEVNNDRTYLDAVADCLALIPTARLQLTASKRLWLEMEDHPSYSRFLQSLVHLLSEASNSQRLVASHSTADAALETEKITRASSEGLTVTDSLQTRSFVSLEEPTSGVQFSPAKEMQGSWTVEFWIRRKSEIAPKLEESSTTATADQAQNFSAAPRETFGRADLLTMPPPFIRTESTEPNVLRDQAIFSLFKNDVANNGGNSGSNSQRLTPVPSSFDEFMRARLESAYGAQQDNSPFATSDHGFGALDDPDSNPFLRDQLRLLRSARSVKESSKSSDVSDPSKKIVPSYHLLYSNNSSIKIQLGGRLFETALSDPNQERHFVNEQALCFGISQKGQKDQTFDYVVPYDEWVHLTLVQSAQSNHLDLYVNGAFKDRLMTKFSLPLAFLGCPRAGQNFFGDVAEMRIWSYPRSSYEIARDMQIDVSKMKGLLVRTCFNEGAGLRTLDSVGTLTSCKLLDCKWKLDFAPKMRKHSIPAFIYSESEEAEGIFGEAIGASANTKELTGVLKRHAVKGAIGKMATEECEVVTLCYRVNVRKATSEPSEAQPEDIEGFLDWTEKGIRSRITGRVGPEDHIEFTVPARSSVLGPGDSLDWTSDLTFRGRVVDDKIEGTFSYETMAPCLPPLKPGQAVLDESLLNPIITFNSKTNMVSAKDDAKKGRYFAPVKIRPFEKNVSEAKSDAKLGSVDSTVSNFTQMLPLSRAESQEDIVIPETPKSSSTPDPVSREPSASGTTTEGTTEVATEKDTEIVSIGRGEGSFWIEWEIVTGRNSIAVGFAEESFLTQTNLNSLQHAFSDNPLVWSYFQYGQVNYGSYSMEKTKFRDGDIIGVQINSDKEIIRFYRNNELVMEFTQIFANSRINRLRPFICFMKGGDRAVFRGVKSGPVEVSFPPLMCVDESGLSRRLFIGSITQGAFSDYAELHYHDSKHVSFGKWAQDGREGVHLTLELEDDAGATSKLISLKTFNKDVKSSEALLRGTNILIDRVSTKASADDDDADADAAESKTAETKASDGSADSAVDSATDFNADAKVEVTAEAPNEGKAEAKIGNTATAVDAASAEGIAKSEDKSEVKAESKDEVKEGVTEAKDNSADEAKMDSDAKVDPIGEAKVESKTVAAESTQSAVDVKTADIESQWLQIADRLKSILVLLRSKRKLTKESDMRTAPTGDEGSHTAPHIGGISDTLSRLSLRRLPVPKKDPASRSSSITIKIRDAKHRDEMNFKVSYTVKFKKVFDVYAGKKGVNASEYRFVFRDLDIAPDATPDSLDMVDDDVILVRPLEKSIMSEDVDAVKKLLETSSAPYILRITLANGATVREGIEIEESSQVRMLACDEIVEAFQRGKTKEGVVRFRVSDGWISERLRGGGEDMVVEVLREILPYPARYKVVRPGEGAKLRAEYLMNSEDLGFIPENTVVEVVEKRLFKDETEKTVRLRIQSPKEWIGWVSDKNHIVEEMTDGKKPSEQEDLELLSELNRRSIVRAHRAMLAIEKSNTDLVNSITPKKKVQVMGTIEVSSDTLFLLNASSVKSQGVTISQNCTAISTDGRSGGKSMALGSRGFARGVHYWEVQVDACNWGSVFIGVAPADTSSWSGYGFINYRATQMFGNETLYGSYYSATDTVGVLLDMDHGTISFIKDGANLDKTVVINMGVAYHNMRKQIQSRTANSTLFPCFGVKQGGDKLSLRPTKWLSCRGLSPAALLERVLEAKSFVSVWRDAYYLSPGRSCISDELVGKVFEAYCLSRCDKQMRYKSRAGVEVSVDIDHESLQKAMGSLMEIFPVQVGSKFKSSYGEGRIIGTRGRQIWFLLEDGGSGAWCWTAQELTDFVGNGLLSFELDAPVHSTPRAFEGDSHGPEIELLLADFSATLREQVWTLQEDEIIAAMTNEISDARGLDPLRIPVDILQAYHDKKGYLKARTSREVCARYIALCVFNRAVNYTLPLCDLGCADTRIPLLHTPFLRVFSDAFVVGDKHRFNNTCRRSVSGSELLDLKRIVFSRVKLSHWNLAVLETTTNTTLPADEFERPDEIKELRVNRPEALDAERNKETLSYASRLKMSIFGQLYESIKSWDDRSLRRSFVHVEDEGQKRAFFVKFAGEGVDDHGGPYRAVFQSAVGEEPASLVELLKPCPNGLAEVGENRDKLVLNTAMFGSDTAQLFTFFGKILAVSCRHNVAVPVPLPALLWKPLVGEQVTVEDLENIDTHAASFFEMLEPVNAAVDVTSREELMMQALQNVLIFPTTISASKPLSPDSAATPEELLASVDGSLATQLMKRLLYGRIPNEMDSTQAEALLAGRVAKLRELLSHLKLAAYHTGMRNLYKGLSAILPTELLTLMTPDEVEKVFCGQTTIDIEHLKKNTVFDGVNPDDE